MYQPSDSSSQKVLYWNLPKMCQQFRLSIFNFFKAVCKHRNAYVPAAKNTPESDQQQLLQDCLFSAVLSLKLT